MGKEEAFMKECADKLHALSEELTQRGIEMGLTPQRAHKMIRKVYKVIST